MYIRKNLADYNYCYEQHSYDTRRALDIDIGFLRLRKSRIASLYYSPTFFNKLPVSIRQLSVSAFKTCIKDLLIRGAYYSIAEFMSANFDSS